MEYLFTLIILTGALYGLYFLITKQINKNSKDNSRELETKLESFIEAFKLTSAENLNKQLQDSKQDQKNMEIRFSETINKMKTLEKILGNQKQRGILGEIQLENLLANVLPPELFQMQYSFNSGEAVDAVIKVGEFIIPIDAKFSLDNYNKMIESDETETDKLNDL
jgi:DNA recombination protein RmuC